MLTQQKDTLAFPTFNKNENLQLLFQDSIQDGKHKYDEPFPTLIEVFAKTEASEKVYIIIKVSTDPDNKEHLPKSMVPDMYFENDDNYPEKRVNELLDKRSSYIVNASAAVWEENKRDRGVVQQQQYYQVEKEHLERLINSQRRTRRKI
ncbi:hypothetical protein IWT140_01049 [Secundilactobacillus pentosiphilus]|uniref:Uncharacterized protein n=1 Tax=Secundilactobacillus pentosiphilus TaxID=1714682 RepID=A0A1Z5IP21_9LACO|nr:hypothetical protein [Secundilactobacillus pentosiphilus]GAX03446.1 hypothetical protein IWT140_01049 [Secundilactobacillus pentosiphilus]